MEKKPATQENSCSTVEPVGAPGVDLSSVSLWLAVPDHDFRICRNTVISLLKFAWWCFQTGLKFHIGGPSGDSLVSRVRNVAVSQFMASDYSHFMFVDSDIGFEPEMVQNLIAADQDVVCGCYPKKCDTTEWPFNFSLDARMVSEVETNGHLMQLRDAPTGFLMIKRSVFERLIEAYPERKCIFGPNQMPEELKYSYDLFSCFVDDTGHYLSEDYGFCRLWERLGGKVWLDPRIALSHFGGKVFAHGSPLDWWRTQTAQKIPGWTEADELAWLMRRARDMDSVVEVGSWLGRSTHALCEGCKGLVYAVDHWNGSNGERDGPHSVAAYRDLYAEFMGHVGHFDNLRPIRMESTAAAQHSPHVDMIWIDAGHTYEDVSSDLSAWIPKARRLICGHDIDRPDVQRAVSEKFPGGWRNPVGRIWAVELQ